MTGSDDDPLMRDFIREWRPPSRCESGISVAMSVADPSLHVRLTPEPADRRPYEILPCDSLTFRCQEYAISAHMDYVFQRFRPFRKRAFEKLIRECERELTHRVEAVTFTERVFWHVRAYFRPDLDLNAVARQMRLTPRSLTRRLACESASFRKILYEVRMEIASHQLRHSSLDVDEVAALAGFSCGSSLRRAVKGWAGMTVSEMRNQGG